MSEREKQHRFLKELMQSDDCAQCRELRARLKKAEKDERCVRSAVFLVTIITLLSGAGLAYSAVLLPEFFQNSTPAVVRIFSALILGCLISLMGFSGFWWWYRRVCNRIFNECRNWIMSLRKIASSSPASKTSAIVPKQGALYTAMTPAEDDDDTQIFTHASF